ncbi:MAG: hypothetical protein NZ480_07355, partial [Bdellovibrionaceae bacterium]|nr:hypothetical protein [Pseudobdellovibrionaceae bacterium]
MAKLVMCLLGVCLLGQYAWGFWGTGMWGALQHCGFEVARSSEVEAIEEEIKERKKDLERTRSELRKKEGRQKILRTRIQGTKESLKQIGFQGDALNFLENHIRNQKKCGEYCSAAGGPPPCNPTNPFPLEQWKPHCGPNDGEVRDTICEVNVSRAPHFHEDRCKERINKWMEDEKELREVTKEVEELKSKIKVLSAELKILGVDLKEARKIYQEELREQILEGECVDCYIVGNQVYRPRKPSGAEILGHVALGAIGSLFQHRLNKYAIDSNAKLGFATQPYPAFMAGFPYFMGALYGAIGGSLGYGGFGCFGGPFGPYGALGPLGLMGVYGNAGMWGYPPGLMGNMMGGLAGGIFLPGMGPWGMNGPWGSAMCITWPCPPMMGGMGGLFPGIFPGMGMNMLGGFPSMFPGMNMLGGFPSMFPGMNMLGGFPTMFPGM